MRSVRQQKALAATLMLSVGTRAVWFPRGTTLLVA